MVVYLFAPDPEDWGFLQRKLKAKAGY